jgi:CheY-like chemotaxis protein
MEDFEAIRRLRNTEQGKSLPVIILVRYEEEMLNAIQKEANKVKAYCVKKPTTGGEFQKLYSAIEGMSSR